MKIQFFSGRNEVIKLFEEKNVYTILSLFIITTGVLI
jgi:hypothetical protein